MLKQLYRAMVMGRAMSVSREIAASMSNAQLNDIGYTRTTLVEQTKASMLAEFKAADAARAEKISFQPVSFSEQPA